MFTKTQRTEAELLRSLDRCDTFIKGFLGFMLGLVVTFPAVSLAFLVGNEFRELSVETAAIAAGIAAAAAAPFAIILIRKL